MCLLSGSFSAQWQAFSLSIGSKQWYLKHVKRKLAQAVQWSHPQSCCMFSPAWEITDNPSKILSGFDWKGKRARSGTVCCMETTMTCHSKSPILQEYLSISIRYLSRSSRLILFHTSNLPQKLLDNFLQNLRSITLSQTFDQKCQDHANPKIRNFGVDFQ